MTTTQQNEKYRCWYLTWEHETMSLGSMGWMLSIGLGFPNASSTFDNKWICVLDKNLSEDGYFVWLGFVCMEEPVDFAALDLLLTDHDDDGWFDDNLERWIYTPEIADVRPISDGRIPTQIIENYIEGQPYVQREIPILQNDILSLDIRLIPSQQKY